MQTFYLERVTDVTGVSGTGRVAEGCIFSDGRVALSWQSNTPSVCLHQSLEAVEQIHGHNGATVIKFVDACDFDSKPLRFWLHHTENKSGLSGVGFVGEGTLFSNGWVAYAWLVTPYQLEFFPTLESFELVHASAEKHPHSHILWSPYVTE